MTRMHMQKKHVWKHSTVHRSILSYYTHTERGERELSRIPYNYTTNIHACTHMCRKTRVKAQHYTLIGTILYTHAERGESCYISLLSIRTHSLSLSLSHTHTYISISHRIGVWTQSLACWPSPKNSSRSCVWCCCCRTTTSRAAWWGLNHEMECAFYPV